MIGKNKQPPAATLYLLGGKNSTKLEEERKSARPSFNNKKSSRSITQYHKWNASKESSMVPFQPVIRTESEIKKLILSKNQFGVETFPIERKLSQILELFSKTRNRPSQPK